MEVWGGGVGGEFVVGPAGAIASSRPPLPPPLYDHIHKEYMCMNKEQFL